MSEDKPKEESEKLNNEFVVSTLLDNIKKTDNTLTKLSLLLVVIVVGYFLVEFGVSKEITIGLITIKEKDIVKMIIPILYGFIFLKTYNISMFLDELRKEVEDLLDKKHGIPSSKIHFFIVFNFTSYLSKFKNLSSWGVTYIISLALISLAFLFVPIIFQIYIINNLFLMEYSPNIVLKSSQIISLILMGIFYGNVIARGTDTVIEIFKKDKIKLDYPKFTLSIFQTIMSLILGIILFVYIKSSVSIDDWSTLQGGIILFLFLTIVLISLNTLTSILQSYREKLPLNYKWINAFTILYNIFIVVVFLGSFLLH